MFRDGFSPFLNYSPTPQRLEAFTKLYAKHYGIKLDDQTSTQHLRALVVLLSQSAAETDEPP